MIIRITTTIIAPSFLTAALFKIVGDIIILLGAKYSRLKPVVCKWPSRFPIFVESQSLLTATT